jgi:hypothetical protein
MTVSYKYNEQKATIHGQTKEALNLLKRETETENPYKSGILRQETRATVLVHRSI